MAFGAILSADGHISWHKTQSAFIVSPQSQHLTKQEKTQRL